MPQAAAKLRSVLNLPDPYTGFPLEEYPPELQGSGEHPLFDELLEAVKPRLILEVGSWKGDSAIKMASILRRCERDAAIVCIDTWLGSLEHVTGTVKGWEIARFREFGYPKLYHQFLANVLHHRCEDYILPVPNTSVNAARWLAQHGVVADLIYLDASHEEDDVYQDLTYYWKLLRQGGVMFGDDWTAGWYGVICAVNRFAREKELAVQLSLPKWVVQKPG